MSTFIISGKTAVIFFPIASLALIVVTLSAALFQCITIKSQSTAMKASSKSLYKSEYFSILFLTSSLLVPLFSAKELSFFVRIPNNCFLFTF